MSIMRMPMAIKVMVATMVPALSQPGSNGAEMDPSTVGHWDALYTESAHSTVVKDFNHAWQGVDFTALRGILGSRLTEASKQFHVLVLGAGDSGLPEEMYDAGWQNVTAVDFSSVIVAAMTARNQGVRPGLSWLGEDARKLSLPEDSVDIAIDTGMLDSVATGGEDKAAQVLLEVHRVLRAGGCYISASTEPPLFRQPLFAQQPPGGWITEVLSLPRPREIDPRIRALDPVIAPGRLHPMLDVGKINVYVSKVPGGLAALPADAPGAAGSMAQESITNSKAKADDVITEPEPTPEVSAAATAPEAVAPYSELDAAAGSGAADPVVDVTESAAATAEPGSDISGVAKPEPEADMADSTAEVSTQPFSTDM